jgi:hypothetical protein
MSDLTTAHAEKGFILIPRILNARANVEMESKSRLKIATMATWKAEKAVPRAVPWKRTLIAAKSGTNSPCASTIST